MCGTHPCECGLVVGRGVRIIAPKKGLGKKKRKRERDTPKNGKESILCESGLANWSSTSAIGQISEIPSEKPENSLERNPNGERIFVKLLLFSYHHQKGSCRGRVQIMYQLPTQSHSSAYPSMSISGIQGQLLEVTGLLSLSLSKLICIDVFL